MAVNKKQSRSVLGDNPLSQGIFSKTVDDQPELPTQPLPQNPQNRVAGGQNALGHSAPQLTSAEQKSIFLENVDKEDKEAVNLRLPITLNDWLNELLKKGKRKHGSKIPKEIWVQAALELFQAMPVNWEEIKDVESLRKILKNLESSFNNLESSLKNLDYSEK
jgi:hypothetical protein